MLDPLASLGPAVLLSTTLLLGGALLAAIPLRRVAAPESRAAFWTLVLGALLVLPLGTRVLPTGWLWAPPPERAEPAPRASAPGDAAAFPSPTTGAPGVGAPPAPAATRSVAGPADRRSSTGAAVAALRDALRAGTFPLWAWVAGVVVLLLRLLRSRLRAAALLRRSEPLGSWSEDLDALRGRAGIDREVVVGASLELDVPVTFGHFRPVILVPASARDWSAERRRCVLLHELAHVARRDWGRALLAELACAVHWFHPLAWVARRRLLEECERAADGTVVAGGVRPSEYARELLRLADELFPTPSRPPSPLLPAVRPTSLEGRVRAILRPETGARFPAGSVAGLTGLLVAASLGVSPVAGEATLGSAAEDPAGTAAEASDEGEAPTPGSEEEPAAETDVAAATGSRAAGSAGPGRSPVGALAGVPATDRGPRPHSAPTEPAGAPMSTGATASPVPRSGSSGAGDPVPAGDASSLAGDPEDRPDTAESAGGAESPEPLPGSAPTAAEGSDPAGEAPTVLPMPGASAAATAVSSDSLEDPTGRETPVPIPGAADRLTGPLPAGAPSSDPQPAAEGTSDSADALENDRAPDSEPVQEPPTTIFPAGEPVCADLGPDVQGPVAEHMAHLQPSQLSRTIRLARRFGRASVALALGVLVAADGSVEEATVLESSGLESLDQRFRQLALKSSWRPAARSGNPIVCWHRLNVDLRF